MQVNVLYETSAVAMGGRDGTAKTKDGTLELTLSTPKELGGAGGTGNNPEQLFAAGYAACFIGALKFVAAQQKDLTLPTDVNVQATVGIGPRSEGGFGLEVALTVDVPGMEKTEAEKLVAAAHEVCPYSNATRNNIDVQLSVTV